MTEREDPVEFSFIVPVTGVINANQCGEWIYDAIDCGIDLGMIEHRKECKDDDCMHEVEGRVLFGKWKKVWVWRNAKGVEFDKKPEFVETKRKKVYAPDETGEYAAIYNKDHLTIQVLWSKHTAFGAGCSPCYPGQASIGEDGGMLLYTLPPELLLENE